MCRNRFRREGAGLQRYRQCISSLLSETRSFPDPLFQKQVKNRSSLCRLKNSKNSKKNKKKRMETRTGGKKVVEVKRETQCLEKERKSVLFVYISVRGFNPKAEEGGREVRGGGRKKKKKRKK